MNRNDILYQLSNEIELLARMHIIYGCGILHKLLPREPIFLRLLRIME